MALIRKEPPRVTRRTWDPGHLANASMLSMEAWQRSNIKRLSEFLTRREGVLQNLFLTNHHLAMSTVALQAEPPYCVLLESPSVGSKWGASDMLLDMSSAPDRDHTIKDYLQAAARFNGSVYLLGVELSDDDASEWWEALQHSPTPPHHLCFLYRFLSSNRSDQTRSDAAAAQCLVDAIIDNKRIKKVTVFMSDFEFSSATTFRKGFSLECLHLEMVSLSDEFLEALSQLNSNPITKTLTLSCHKGSTWHPSFHRFLQWQLEALTLLGFDLKIPDLRTFLKYLQDCRDTSLHSLSLGDAKDEMSMARVVRGTYPQNDSGDALVAVILDALYGSGLPFFSLQGLNLCNVPAIEVCLLQNQRRHFEDLQQQEKEPAMALRLFVCGDEFAGKSALSSSLAAACSKQTRASRKAKNILINLGIRQDSGRTQGIEVYKIKKDEVHISLWDVAGQREFRAFHEYMFQDATSNHRCPPAMFMFVWSPVVSKDRGDGGHKSVDAFQESFWYWLKFIASKTRQSHHVACKVIVVITRKDQRRAVQSLLKSSIKDLEQKFKGIVEIAGVLEVNATETSSVKPLASCIFKTAKDVLHRVETYAICRRVRRHLFSAFKIRNEFKDQPIIAWDAFEKLCKEKFKINGKHVHRAIASYLNASGDLIYLGNMLVLDISWFCQDILGKLIDFPGSLPNHYIPVRSGFETMEYVESILQEQAQNKVQGSQLVDLMEAMNLCCKDQGNIFIPATLFTSSSREPGAPLGWRRNTNGIAAYLGRRLECDKKDLTILTPGLFLTLQVLFLKAFNENGEIGADVKLDRDFMSICIGDMEIILESGIVAQGEHVIDVMAQAPAVSDRGKTLALYVENKIIQTIIQVCAQPEGNQGIKLVEGAIHPDCLLKPASLKERENQCVSVQDLKQELMRQIEAGMQQQTLQYKWKGNRHQPFVDLLGVKVVREVLLLYKKSWESADEEARQIIDSGRRIQNNLHITHEDVASTSTYVGDHTSYTLGESSTKLFEEEPSLQHQISEAIAEDLSDGIEQKIVVLLSKTMVSSINQELQKYMNTKFDELKLTMQSVVQPMQEEVYRIRSEALPRILKIVEQTLCFAVGEEEGKVPRLVYLTMDDKVGMGRRMVTSIFKGSLESVRIELFCEHREHPHRVEGQKGLGVTTVNDGALKKALPWLNKLLKVLTLVAKVGAHVVAGAGDSIPDLGSMIAHGLDTPGFLDNQGLLQEACSSREALLGWQEWLAGVLNRHGGMRERNITQHFNLRRAIYCDTSYVAWLCPQHFPPFSSSPNTASGLLIRPHPLISQV